MTSAVEKIESTFRSILLATCPCESCRHNVLFRSSAQRVKCPFCNNIWTVMWLVSRGATTASICMQWIQERASEMETMNWLSKGRTRMVNRTIDGLGGPLHAFYVARYVNEHGVDADGNVRRLSAMGRSEPLNVVTLSNYAFGIRKEHLDVAGYGMCNPLSEPMINAMRLVSHANGKMGDVTSVLIPVGMIEKNWFLNAISGVSIACCGRLLFYEAIRRQTVRHLVKWGELYKLRAQFKDDKWAMLSDLDPRRKADTSIVSSIIDLAVLANVMYRTIILVDSPKIKVFVPFMRRPEDCYDRAGAPRSPLVFCWGDAARTFKVPMVAVADMETIEHVRLPKQRFESVWGFPNKKESASQLDKYLKFDTRGCLVAQGIYFAPEHMHEYVKAFEKFNVISEQTTCGLKSDFEEDLKTGIGQDRQAEMLQQATDGGFLRCVSCGRLHDQTSVHSAIDCVCTVRKQKLNEQIEYEFGDHTMTPAPKSWCPTKRKHYYGGNEYDNPPLRIEVAIKVAGKSHRETISWFSGESDSSMNSNAYEIAAEVVKNALRQTEFKQTVRAVDEIDSQIKRKVGAASMAEHQFEHVKECLAHVEYANLFDDYSEPIVSTPDIADMLGALLKTASNAK